LHNVWLWFGLVLTCFCLVCGGVGGWLVGWLAAWQAGLLLPFLVVHSKPQATSSAIIPNDFFAHSIIIIYTSFFKQAKTNKHIFHTYANICSNRTSLTPCIALCLLSVFVGANPNNCLVC
jgi:hypothetical protein